MKKTLVLAFCVLLAGMVPLFALSYENNQYQRKSRAHAELARKAFDSGDYDAAIRHSELAEQYAQESADFIQRMLARVEAEQAMNRARTRYTWAKNNGAETRYAEEFVIATAALEAGSTAFDNKDYDVAVVSAQKVLDALSSVEGDEGGLQPLPAEFRVRTWRTERDCLWNIAENPAVYGNPFMWNKLYQANKDKLPDANNPDWLEPDIILTIPSIRGEKRSGRYDPNKTYQSLPKK